MQALNSVTSFTQIFWCEPINYTRIMVIYPSPSLNRTSARCLCSAVLDWYEVHVHTYIKYCYEWRLIQILPLMLVTSAGIHLWAVADSIVKILGCWLSRDNVGQLPCLDYKYFLGGKFTKCLYWSVTTICLHSHCLSFLSSLCTIGLSEWLFITSTLRL